MNIYSILSSKPHNPHYLNRYIKFIESCPSVLDGESHHICPKSNDLFPEFKSFTEFPWNRKLLTLRQHYIAHLLLWKSYRGSQTQAFWLMCNRLGKSSRLYEKARQEHCYKMTINNPNKDGSGSRKQWASASSNRHKQQSETATKRNLEYWSTRKLPILDKQCCICGSSFQTNAVKRICCSKSCAAKYRNNMRVLDNKEPA